LQTKEEFLKGKGAGFLQSHLQSHVLDSKPIVQFSDFAIAVGRSVLSLVVFSQGKPLLAIIKVGHVIVKSL
jgi:hypothetical protein